MPSGVVFHDVSVHFSNGRFWAAPAAKPQMSREGVHLRDAHTAKFLYFPMVTFVTKEIRDKFSDAVIAALRLVHPDAFVIEPEEVDADALV